MAESRTVGEPVGVPVEEAGPAGRVVVLAPGETLTVFWQRPDFQPTEREELTSPPSTRSRMLSWEEIHRTIQKGN